VKTRCQSWRVRCVARVAGLSSRWRQLQGGVADCARARLELAEERVQLEELKEPPAPIAPGHRPDGEDFEEPRSRETAVNIITSAVTRMDSEKRCGGRVEGWRLTVSDGLTGARHVRESPE